LPQPLVLASRNEHKLREFGRLLEPYGLRVEPLPAEVVLPPEDGDSYEHNARVKALTAAVVLGRETIADDSGIEAQALGGRPGVRSARFAGEAAGDADNLAKLLRLAPPGSGLRYVCAVAFAGGPGERAGTRIFMGECHGRLAGHQRGARGFGYDPAFLPDEIPDGSTMAQLEDAAKDSISHRGRAVRAFAEWYLAR
jgi:XTP/dITP diphosphohydrolase